MASGMTSGVNNFPHGGTHLKAEKLPPSSVNWTSKLKNSVVLRGGAPGLPSADASTCTTFKHDINDLIMNTSIEQVSSSYLRAFFSEMETVQSAFQYSQTPCVLLSCETPRKIVDDKVHVVFTCSAKRSEEVRQLSDLQDTPWLVRSGDWVETLIRVQEIFPDSWLVCIQREPPKEHPEWGLPTGLALAGSLVSRWASYRITRTLCRDFSINNKVYCNEKRCVFDAGDFLAIPSQLIKEQPESLHYLKENPDFGWLSELADEKIEDYLDDNLEERQAQEKRKQRRRDRLLKKERELLKDTDDSVNESESGKTEEIPQKSVDFA